MNTAWTAFGIAGETEPNIRERERHLWPRAEVYEGMARVDVRFTVWGDEPRGAVVQVWGTSPEAAREWWNRVNIEVCRTLVNLHPHSQCGRMVPQDRIGRSGEEDAG